MAARDENASPMANVRPFDQELLGLEPHPDDPSVLSLVVVPSLCRTDGRFYGGAALAAALAASEAATGRLALWSSTQLVATADIGERIRIDVDVLASGRTADQVQVRGTVGERVVFNAVGTAATGRADGMHGVGQAMPRVPAPEACESWRLKQQAAMGFETLAAEMPKVGHHLVSEMLDAPILDASASRPGHMGLWARFTGDLQRDAVPTPAGVGFLADMVPIAVARACGVAGAGTSLDNSLRVGDQTDLPSAGGWVLLEVDAHIAVGGFGHGDVLIWSPDGQLLATGSQSARLFSIEDFLSRRSGGS